MLRLTGISGETFLINPDHIVTVREAQAESGAQSTLLLDNGISVLVKESISEVGAWLLP